MLRPLPLVREDESTLNEDTIVEEGGSKEGGVGLCGSDDTETKKIEANCRQRLLDADNREKISVLSRGNLIVTTGFQQNHREQ